MAYRICLSDRDISALEFIWKWKIATTMTLTQKIYSSVEVPSAYSRICLLRQSGLVRTVRVDDQKGDLWTLTEKGFRAIRNKLPALAQEGFRPEHVNHDMHVSAFQLTPFLCNEPPGLTLVSDQELKHVDRDDLHSSVPRSTLHRPDGYWIFTQKDNRHFVVALEVELNFKSLKRYESVADFYRHEPSINEVLWLTNSAKSSEKILKAMEQGDIVKGAKHSFMIHSDFIDAGIHTVFSNGFRSGVSLREILPNMSLTCHHLGHEKLLLEKKICPFKSINYRSQYFSQESQLTRDSRLCTPHGETHE